jgi:hypothetical protein
MAVQFDVCRDGLIPIADALEKFAASNPLKNGVILRDPASRESSRLRRFIDGPLPLDSLGDGHGGEGIWIEAEK